MTASQRTLSGWRGCKMVEDEIPPSRYAERLKNNMDEFRTKPGNSSSPQQQQFF
jgi:hypothetical protein